MARSKRSLYILGGLLAATFGSFYLLNRSVLALAVGMLVLVGYVLVDVYMAEKKRTDVGNMSALRRELSLIVIGAFGSASFVGLICLIILLASGRISI